MLRVAGAVPVPVLDPVPRGRAATSQIEFAFQAHFEQSKHVKTPKSQMVGRPLLPGSKVFKLRTQKKGEQSKIMYCRTSQVRAYMES